MSKFKLSLSSATTERLKMALGQDSSIITTPDQLGTHDMFPESYYIDLGLTHGDMLRLERCGFAVRGYSKNFWDVGEKMPNGKEAVFQMRGRGHTVRWVLVAREVV